MNSRIATLATLLSTVGVVMAPACDDIRSCQDKGCQPMYSMHLESPEPDLAAGRWNVDLQIDGGMVSAECMVTGPIDDLETIPCELGPWTSEPSQPLDVSVGISSRITEPGSGEPTDTGDPPEVSNTGISITVYFDAQDTPLQSVDVTVFYEDALAAEAQRRPTFEVEEDFGGPGCGTCLRPEQDVITLP